MPMSRQAGTPTFPAPEQQIAILQAQLESLARDNVALASDNARLAKEAALANAALKEMAEKVDDLKAKMERLVEQIKLANMRFFGSKSERVVPGQLSLFNDMEAAAADLPAEPDDEKDPPRPRRRGGRRRIDTSEMERVVVEHTIDDPACPHCGSEMSEMKVEVTEVIRLVPAHLVVEEHRRHVYKCAPCCAANARGDDVSSQIVRAPMPATSPVPGSFAHASLISAVINSKYANSMPLYRIEGELRALGADISRQDMANWVMNVHIRWLSRVHARMRERLLEGRYINADETEVQVLKEPGREPKRRSYMWLFRSGPHDVPNCIFEYHPTRSGKVARDFLKGWSGYLTTDGYDPYFNLGIEGIVNTACLVHIRRKFAEIVKSAGGDMACEGADSLALEARRRIDRIFRADGKLDEMGPEARREARIEKIAPMMVSFKQWAEEAMARAVPGLALHKALAYALKYWPFVMNVLEDGNLGLDNNIAERSIKPFVIGRKNWLFSDTPRGAEASAAVYSIVVTAKQNGLNQRAYIEWLLTEMPNDKGLDGPGRIDRYLPWSDAVPRECRLSPEKAAAAAEMPDEPIIDPDTLKAALENS